jgi:hypothetical protein
MEGESGEVDGEWRRGEGGEFIHASLTTWLPRMPLVFMSSCPVSLYGILSLPWLYIHVRG